MNNLLQQDELNSLLSGVSVSQFKNKNILITGGTGMIGSYLVEAIIKLCIENQTIPRTIVVPLRTMIPSGMDALIDYEWISYCSYGEIELRGPFHFVIHAASPSNVTKFIGFDDLYAANMNLLSAIDLTELETFLYVSSGEVTSYLGDQNFSKQELVDPKRILYPEVKLATENYLQELAHNNFNLAIVRLYHSFGPGLRFNDGRSFGEFLWGSVRNERIQLRTSGNQVRTFLYSLDVVSGFLKTLFQTDGTQIYELGSTHPLTIREFANMVSRIAGQQDSIIMFEKDEKDEKNSGFDSLIPDIREMSKLGWNESVQIEDAISRTVRWIKSQAI
jgi:UDP-glucuronate decarboxylase